MIRRVPDDQLGELQPLFEQVFKHAISLDLLHWKYAEGRGESWLADGQDGAASLHCGLLFRDVRFKGQTLRAAQLVDLMAPPKASGLSRSGSPFAVLMRKILADLPRPDNPCGVAFGFPSDRAMRLGERIGVYRQVDRLMELEFAPRHRRFAARWRVLTSIADHEAAVIDGLWRRMHRDLSDFAVGVRDASYLRHRYLAYPGRHYTVLLIEGFWRRQPLGLAVIGPGTDRRELLDMVCAWRDTAAVLGAVQSWMAQSAVAKLQFSLTEHFARQLAPLAVRCEPTQFRIMGNPLIPPGCIDSLDQRWWLTSGDTDYR